ncbi:hypothetical protein LUZ60_001637 [Juncus effusus]|nr:hypothetical protein LUZ60_001637 [Juncus effusus]
MIMPDSFPSTSNHAIKQENNDSLRDWPYFSKVPKENNEPISGTSSPKNNGFVYKRRKFAKNGVALLKELEKSQDKSSKDLKELEKSQINQSSKDLKDKFCSSSNSENCDLDPNINEKIITRSSKHAKIQKKQVSSNLSSRDLCISILKNQWESKNQISSINTPNGNAHKNKNNNNNNKVSIRCKVCNALEYSNKMLICDKCEEAYHLSCSNERAKRIKMGNWYCLSCSSARPVLPHSKILEERKRLNCRDGNPIRAMLSDRWHHTIGVRVGKDFQADVPDWLGPIDHDLSPCLEPMEFDLLESSTSNLWCNRPKSKGVGNWVQCREITHTNDNDQGTICGKWRRVPFSVEQTDDWECSYLLPYDPFHADCAVPQEVENDVVYEQLKYSHKFQKLLERKKK